MKETLIALLSASIETLGESKLIDLLQHLHDTDQAKYKSVLLGGYSFAIGMGALAEKSKTPIDDMLVNAVKDAIVTSAGKNGIELPVL